MKCSEIMQKEVITCRQSESASDTAKLMRDQNIGFVPVVDDDGKVCGTVTDRDLVVRMLAEGKNGSTTLRDIMTRDVVSCSPDDDISTCEEKMEQSSKSRMLVLDGGRVCGVISLSDIAQCEKPARAGELLRRVTTRESRTDYRDQRSYMS
jgi:CBS domain-containing protein